MAKRKTKWPCGHEGFGQFCHRCDQKRKAIVARQVIRKTKRAAAAKDIIDLSCLPEAQLPRAREIIRRVISGKHWSREGGRKLRSNTFIVFELGTWRLLGRAQDGFEFVRACSHETYNKLC